MGIFLVVVVLLLLMFFCCCSCYCFMWLVEESESVGQFDGVNVVGG